MKLIVAADKNWGIGRNNSLLVRIPEDMKNFRLLTQGNVVVMGRKTLDSFPGGLPLPKRVNIVLTRQENYDGRGAIVVHDEEELWDRLAAYDTDRIFVIGGESIYRLLLPYCDTAYVTRLDYAYEADTWMPDLDREEGWFLAKEGEEQTCFDLLYYFNQYQNRYAKALPRSSIGFVSTNPGELRGASAPSFAQLCHPPEGHLSGGLVSNAERKELDPP